MTATFARTTDPATSHEAVPTASKRALLRLRVLEILGEHGPLTHDQIYERYIVRHEPGTARHTTRQNVRSRTSELEQAYMIRAVDRDGTSPTGRRATRWDIWRDEK